MSVLKGNEIVFENLIALHIAIEKQCPQEVAFKYLDNYLNNKPMIHKPCFKWTNEDIQDVKNLRKLGLGFDEIGSYYGLKVSAINKVYRSNNERNKKRVPEGTK
ncbi:MAG: hypothetical protein AB6733_10905 [Clostridiaceae bacterium]